METLLQNPNFLAMLCGVGAFAVVILVWTALIENDPLPARLRNIADRKRELREEERRKKMTRRVTFDRVNFMKRIAQHLKLEQGKKLDLLRIKLARAGYRSRDTMFVFLFAKLAAPIGFAASCLLFPVRSTPVQCETFVGALHYGVRGCVWIRAARHPGQEYEPEARRHPAQGDARRARSSGDLRGSGLSLDLSLERVSREMGPSCAELAEEVGLTAVELNFLPERAKALQNLADRVPLPGVVALSNTLIQTEKYGTPLAQALRVLSSEMREERMMAAETKAAKLPATLTIPMILFILPPLFIVLLGPAILKVMGLGH